MIKSASLQKRLKVVLGINRQHLQISAFTDFGEEIKETRRIDAIKNAKLRTSITWFIFSPCLMSKRYLI